MTITKFNIFCNELSYFLGINIKAMNSGISQNDITLLLYQVLIHHYLALSISPEKEISWKNELRTKSGKVMLYSMLTPSWLIFRILSFKDLLNVRNPDKEWSAHGFESDDNNDHSDKGGDAVDGDIDNKD